MNDILAQECDPGPEPKSRESPAKEDTHQIPPRILNDTQTSPDTLLNERSSELQTTRSASEPELESAALDHQKHVLAGMEIYERASKGHRSTTRADEFIQTVTKLDICNTFVVRSIDLNFEGEAALGTRLKEGTNRKRARTINLQQLNHHNRLLELSNIQEQDDRRAARSHSEEIDTEACARARSLHFLGNTAPWTEEGHAGDDMSERSSGTKRRTRSSLTSTIETPPDNIGGVDTSGTLEEEFTAPADPDEAVYISGSSKRIRPDQGLKVAEKEGKELRPTVSTKKENDAFSTSGAHDPKASTTSSEAPKRKSWPAFDRYKDPQKHVLVDYGPRAFIPKTPQEANEAMPTYPGGPKPVNRLSSSSKANPILPHKSQRSGLPKAFDLNSEASRSRRPNEYPSKRQRIENGSSTSPIEVNDASPQQSKDNRPASTRSGHSQTLPSSRDRSASFGGRESSLHEIRQVNDNMKPPKSRKRNGTATENRISVINGHQRFNKDAFDVVAREDQNDLISDDEATATGSGRSEKWKNKLEVQITGYQGSSFHGPPRQKANVSSRVANSPPMEVAEASPYFPSSRNLSRAEENPRERRQGINKNSRAVQARDLLSQDDQDELAIDRFGHAKHADTAQRLLKKGQPARLGNEVTKAPIDLSGSSEDEISKDPDIKPGKYGSSKGDRRTSSGEESYTVHQLFSDSTKWLLPDEMSTWVMNINKPAGLLSFYDASNQSCFQFHTMAVDKVEFSNPGTRIVLHKARSETAAGGAVNVYIQMSTTEEAQQFIESLSSLDPTLKTIPKEQEHLEKVFRNIAQKPIRPKHERQEEPDDLRLAKAKAEKKLFGTNWRRVDSTKKGSEDINGTRQPNGNFESGTRPKGLARNMRGQSQSSEILEVDSHRKPSNSAACPPGDFYGTSDHSRLNGADSHGTRSSRRVTTVRATSPAHRQSPRRRPRSPSPEPERWTFQNPDWVTNEKWQSSVIYPPDGKNKASVDMQDIQRLDEGEFLNDNLIVFYLRWLEDRLGKGDPELASRIYFTNTFFYERLTKHGKGKSGGINYEAVERWTSKIDLLKYDYIVVPVNETIHWYVAIICNAPKLLKQVPSEITSQPDSKNAEVGDDSSKVELDGKAMPSPLKSPAKTLPDEVDAEMREMTLDDRAVPLSDAHASKAVSEAPIPAEDKKDTEMVDLDLPPTTVVSDLIEQRPVQAKKGKRKSLPAIRKYNPEEPRIITLDSLGLTHSPTCTNLKKYLLQEFKAKKNIEIDDPGSLGMTAKNIPQQNNHCDCGLFLLTYIEEFLKRPDDFVRDLMQQNEQDFSNWRSASDMREHIRDVLFDLQRKQNRQAEISRKEKAKSKQAAKAGDKSASASSSKSASREASKSVRGSPIPEEAHYIPESKESHAEKSDRLQKPTPRSKQVPKHVDEDAPIKAGSLKSSAIESHDDEAQSTWNHACGNDEDSPSRGRSHDVKATESQPITIEDSQDKDGDEDRVEEVPSPPAKTIKKPKNTRPSLKGDVRGSKSLDSGPTIENLEHPRQESAKEESRSKESSDLGYILPHPLPNSSSPRGHQDQHQSSRISGRRTRDRGIETTKATNSTESGKDAQEPNKFEVANPDHSSDDVQLVGTSLRNWHNGTVIDSQQEDDDDLLMPNSPPPESAEVQLLTSSSSPDFAEAEVVATKRSQAKAAPSSPRDLKRPSSHLTGERPRPAKRQKSVIDLVGDDSSPKDKLRGRADRANLRDASDRAVMGNKANHYHFG